MSGHKRESISMIAWNLILSAAVICMICYVTLQHGGRGGRQAFSQDTVTKYTLYIGLNDGDSHEQNISTEQAVETVNEICLRHAGGYTLLNASGGWTDEEGQTTVENTLCYVLTDIEEEQVRAIMDEVLEALNRDSILVEKGEIQMEYYSG